MSYIVYTDLSIPESKLIDLTDDENAGSLSAEALARIAAAIADAEAEVDSYCGVKYDVPFATPPQIVKLFSKQISEYLLFGRRDRIPEAVQKAYDNAIKTLQKIAEGKITLGVDPPPDAATNGDEVQTSTPGSRIFDRTSLENF